MPSADPNMIISSAKNVYGTIGSEKKKTPYYYEPTRKKIIVKNDSITLYSNINNQSNLQFNKLQLYDAADHYKKKQRNFQADKKSSSINANTNHQNIFVATKKNQVQQLLKYTESLNGSDLDIIDNQGNTPVYYAVVNMHLEVLKCLVDKGADINKRCELG